MKSKTSRMRNALLILLMMTSYQSQAAASPESFSVYPYANGLKTSQINGKETPETKMVSEARKISAAHYASYYPKMDDEMKARKIAGWYQILHDLKVAKTVSDEHFNFDGIENKNISDQVKAYWRFSYFN
ncbi:hypothetical protein ACWJJH_03200 [Endozoicomonadaceae bacterium StTr2]